MRRTYFKSSIIASFLTLAASALWAGNAMTDPTIEGPAAVLSFDDKGAQVGEQLPDLSLVTLDNEPIHLHDKANGRLTLIVTSSFTCPKSRANYPPLAEIAAKYNNKIDFLVMYVIEAHPSGDPSPYRNGKEDVTPENIRDEILRRQPTTLDKRLVLANDFVTRLNVKIPIACDGMENWAWKSLGAGPNLALLIDSDHVVVARQGWFNATTLPPLLDKALADAKALTDARVALGMFETSPADQALIRKMLDAKEFEGDGDLRALVEDKSAPKLESLLTKYPALATMVTPHQPRGDTGGETLLQTAAAGNHLAAAKLLLLHGGDPNQSSSLRAYPLFLAAQAGNTEIVKLLLDKTKEVDARFSNGPTAYQAALLNNHPEVAALLSQAGAKDNFFTQLARGNLEFVTQAIAKDPSLAGRSDGLGHTPLTYAAANGQTEMVHLLNTASPEGDLAKLSSDINPVILAIDNHHAETLLAILNAGGNPNADTFYAGTAVHHAVTADDPKSLAVLLQAGGKPNPGDAYGHAPLHDAAYSGNLSIIQLLLAAGADINAKTGDIHLPCGPGTPSATLETPLHFAVDGKHIEAVDALLAAHADASAQDVHFRNALHHALATETPSAAIVRALLAAKTPINAEDEDGKSPLDYATQHKNAELIKLLTDAGANPAAEKNTLRPPPPKAFDAMPAHELNFDSLIGPTHNYAGLAQGNRASQSHRHQTSHPRQAALQGLDKMKFLADLGYPQALLPPQLRPDIPALHRLGFRGTNSQILAQAAKSAPHLLAACTSSSSMWAANAATISPAPDTADRKLHITPANLSSHFHRSLETPATAALFRHIFPAPHFIHHAPLPSTPDFADEGAANHNRLCLNHDQSGLELFIYGRDTDIQKSKIENRKSSLPRQSLPASQSIARLHQLNPAHTFFAQQNPRAIAAGVFHNDVISVAHRRLFLYHELAFQNSRPLITALQKAFTHLHGHPLLPLKIPNKILPLQDAVRSYLFNSQLLTAPNSLAAPNESYILIAPTECQQIKSAQAAIRYLQDRAPIEKIHYLNVRQSMHNGGGPACLRIRIVLTENEQPHVHQPLLLTNKLHTQLKSWINKNYRESLNPKDLADPHLLKESQKAQQSLAKILHLPVDLLGQSTNR